MTGVQIKMRKHLGLNHQKSVILYGKGVTIFGSSNWTGPSSNFQDEHNYFTVKPLFFTWFRDQFERKWNSTTENQPFVPLGPDEPAYSAPLNGATVNRRRLRFVGKVDAGHTSTTSIWARHQIRRCLLRTPARIRVAPDRASRVSIAGRSTTV
jgi:hypothetical protein